MHESINVSFIKLIALFNNMRTLKFKAKQTITVNLIRKQKQQNGSKSANHEPEA